MPTLTSLTIWLRWEQAFGSGSDFAGSSGSGFAESKLVAGEQAVSGGFDFAGRKLVAVECSLSPL